MKQLPAKLLQSRHRKALWKNAQKILRQIQKVLPVAEIHLMGSYMTSKKNPSDIDFVILLQTPKGGSDWPLDLVIAPHNKQGEKVLRETQEWFKQKYGSKKSACMRLK